MCQFGDDVYYFDFGGIGIDDGKGQQCLLFGFVFGQFGVFEGQQYLVVDCGGVFECFQVGCVWFLCVFVEIGVVCVGGDDQCVEFYLFV